MDVTQKNNDVRSGTTDEEPSVTMLEVLEAEKELEDEYAAVLGGSDENSCTYAQGKVKRQALYSCLTCNPEARDNLEKCAGICLACSYQCHENHELIELYTKRNFRCDCPTKRFEKNVCMLNPSVEKPLSLNEHNTYNQNFQGLYCKCKRPYPDPERTTEELMVQCIICEDWYHIEHLGLPESARKLADTCNEMICVGCMEEHAFLRDYTGIALKQVDVDKSDLNLTVDESTPNDSTADKSIAECSGADQVENEPETKRQKMEDEKPKSSSGNSCTRPQRPIDCQQGTVFWRPDWRLSLCKCDVCLELYRKHNIEYLTDTDDSSKSYEERGMKRVANETSSYERGINALASMDRVKQIDAITEYNRMKDKLKEYLQTFVTNNQVVTEADINRFFESMRNERHANNIGLPHFCR